MLRLASWRSSPGDRCPAGLRAWVPGGCDGRRLAFHRAHAAWHGEGCGVPTLACAVRVGWAAAWIRSRSVRQCHLRHPQM